jgi:hypothetical protein
MRADIEAGAVFPDYELTDHTGKHRKRLDLQGPDPMIVVLSGRRSPLAWLYPVRKESRLKLLALSFLDSHNI